MNARLIGVVIASAIVVAIVIVLFVKSSSSTSSTSHSSGGTAVVVTTDPSAPPAPSLPGGTQVTDTAAQPPAGSGEYPTDYVVGDIRVRDHRGGNNKPLDVPPNPHPGAHRELPSGLTSSLSHEVKLVFFDCGKDVPKDARGGKPKLEGQLTTAIKDHKLTVTGAVAQIRDVAEPYQSQLKQCVEQKSVGTTVSASDQDDITDYGIQISFALP